MGRNRGKQRIVDGKVTTATFAGEPGEFPGQCAAAVSNGTRRCRAHAVKGRLVCPKHGGGSLAGAAAGGFKHGKRSRIGRYDVSEAWAKDYEWFLENRAALLESHDEIALIATRIQELLDRLGTDDPGAANKQVFRAFRAFWGAQAGGNVTKMRETLESLRDAVDAAERESSTYDELWHLVDLLRKVRATETRRIVAERESMTMDQTRVFMRGVQHAVLKTFALADPEIERQMRLTFSEELRRTLSANIVGS